MKKVSPLLILLFVCACSTTSTTEQATDSTTVATQAPANADTINEGNDYSVGEQVEDETGAEADIAEPPRAEEVPFSLLGMDDNISDDYSGITMENKGTTFGPGHINQSPTNKAAYFNGRSTYLIAPHLDDFEQATYLFWLKLDEPVTRDMTILGIGNNCTSGYSLRLAADGVINVLCGGVNVNITGSSTTIEPGKWTHIALIKNVTIFTIYIDGEIASEGESTYNGFSPTSRFTIGAGSGCEDENVGEFFKGAIDDVVIFSSAMSESEIRGVMGWD